MDSWNNTRFFKNILCVWTPANVCLFACFGLFGFLVCVFFFLMFWVVERRETEGFSTVPNCQLHAGKLESPVKTDESRPNSNGVSILNTGT